MTDELNGLTRWINSELRERGWSFRELGRRSGLSPTTISDILAGKTNPGFDFCRGIATAFGAPPERVLRLAGLLPPVTTRQELIDEIVAIFDSMDRDDQLRLINIAHGLARGAGNQRIRPA